MSLGGGGECKEHSIQHAYKYIQLTIKLANDRIDVAANIIVAVT